MVTISCFLLNAPASFFFALGIARQSRKPVSAGLYIWYSRCEFLPAVRVKRGKVRSAAFGLTADRPQGRCHSGRAVDQLRLGTYELASG